VKVLQAAVVVIDLGLAGGGYCVCDDPTRDNEVGGLLGWNRMLWCRRSGC